MDLWLDLNVFLKLIVISVLAGVLGWERESAGKSAGLRTHLLVGISSVLFIVIGELMFSRYSVYGQSMRFDPVRILEAIVTGISFLGAGMIFFSRSKKGVRGLTTAAGILTTAAIGMIVGLERYILAAGCTLIVFTILHFVNKFESYYASSSSDSDRM